jgi:hypothetical protein
MRIRILLALLALALAAQAALAQSLALLLQLSGSYETTIELEDALAQGFAGRTDLVGDWTVTIREDGHIEWHYEASDDSYSYDMNSVYVVHEARLLIGASSGRHRPREQGVTAGVYTWSWQDDALVLEAVDDAALERRIVLTAHPLVPVEDDAATTE